VTDLNPPIPSERANSKLLRLVCGVVASLALSALAAGPALAAPEWSTPASNLVETALQRTIEPQVAVGSNGDAVAVWAKYASAGNALQADIRLEAGAKWAPPVVLSSGGSFEEPQVALDGEGRTVVAWRNNTGVYALTGSVSGETWGSPVTVATTTSARHLRLAVNDAGAAMLVWADTQVVYAAAGTTAGGWQAPVAVSGATPDANAPDVALDGQGDATVVWENYNASLFSEYISAATHPFGGTWQAPVTLSSGTQLSRLPLVAADASGDVIAAWVNTSEKAVQSVQGYAPAGSWGTVVELAPPGSTERPESLSLEVNPRGEALAGYATLSAAGEAVKGSAVTGEWLSPVTYTTAGEAVGSNVRAGLSLDRQGDAVAVWLDTEAKTIYAAARAVGAEAFTAPEKLFGAGVKLGEPQVSFGGAGVAAAVWEHGEQDVSSEELSIQADAYTGTVLVPVAPTVVTGPASGVGAHEATLTGTVNPNGAEVSSCRFEYGTSPSYGSTVACPQTVGSGEARVAVTGNAPGLAAATTYYYRVVAGDGAGTSYGSSRTFTTPPASPVNTLLPTINGTPEVSDTVTCLPGAWSSEPGIFAYSYQWSLDGVPIPGATGTTYVIPTAAGGHSLTCTVTASDGVRASAVSVAVPVPRQSLQLSCSGRAIVLISVLQSGHAVVLNGFALARYAGKKVSISISDVPKRYAKGKGGSTVVQSNGSFSAKLVLPTGRLAPLTRYTASVEGESSLGLKLGRNLIITAEKAAPGGSQVSFRFVGPRGPGKGVIQFTREESCTSNKIVATAKLTKTNTLTVSLPAPGTPGETSYYRAQTRIAAGITYSLPIAVANG